MKKLNEVIVRSAKAINKAEKMLGSEKALAKKIGATKQKLDCWKSHALLPHDKIMRTYIATNGAISLNELRPNLTDTFNYRLFKKAMYKNITCNNPTI